MVVSKKLIAAIKLNNDPAYRIAWKANVHPNVLSKLLNGIEKPKPADSRIIAVGAVLDIPPAECFEEATQQ